MFKNKKVLIVVPHLSTGGSPQYLLDFLITFKNDFSDLLVIEHSNFSNEYVIQKNKIINLIGQNKLISLGWHSEEETVYVEKRKRLIDIIGEFSPDIIWMNEFPECYDYKLPPQEVMDFLYRKNRNYKIVETTHNNAFNFNRKLYIPDEFMFCSPLHMEKSKNIDIPKIIWEVPIQPKVRPNREEMLKNLGLNPHKTHVLHVGLFHANKNQKYIFEIARDLSDVEFHFIGNTCFLNDCNIGDDLKLPNCNVWGERNDVDLFMSCMDIYLFPSKRELNPLTVKEALSWGMDVIVNRDDNYVHQYKNFDNFYIIDEIDVKNFILNKNKFNTFTLTYDDGIKFEVNGDQEVEYDVRFYDDETGENIYSTILRNNMWAKPSFKYYIKWRTEVWVGNDKIYEEILDLTNKKVLITFESSSLGDSIAWVPYVEEFRKKHSCEVHCITFKNFLYEKEYSNVKFITHNQKDSDYGAIYKIGWFFNEEKNPKDMRTIPLQQTATDILGLEPKEIRTKLSHTPTERPIQEKYVTISIHSTSQCKYWNKIGGWEKVIDFVKSKGYQVLCVDQYPIFGVGQTMNQIPKNALNYTGKSFQEFMNNIYHSEFHMGVGSGDSWLAWGLGKKVLMVSSFSEPFCEFKEDNYRVYKKTYTSGYFNDIRYRFNASDWNWNPFKEMKTLEDWDKFETIEVEDVIDVVKGLIG